MNDQIKLLTIRQAAKLVDGFTEHHIRTLIKSKELPHIKSGNRVLIDEQEIYNYITFSPYKGGMDIE